MRQPMSALRSKIDFLAATVCAAVLASTLAVHAQTAEAWLR